MRRGFRHEMRARTYLSRRQRAWIYGVLVALWGSGALWLVIHYLFPDRGEFGDAPGVAEPWLLTLHGAAAFATLWLCGWMWAVHVRPWWKNGQRRTSGVLLSATIVLLIASGYLLYYAADETLLHGIAVLHWVIGLLLGAIVIAHALRSRRYRRPPSLPPREAEISPAPGPRRH
jgi:hypothetical protein